MTDTITLPRSVVEQALEAMDDVASDSRLLDMSPTRIYVFDSARDDLRAALEQPQVEQGPFAVLVRKHSWHLDTWEVGPQGNLDYGKAWADERINVYTHPQNLNCKSNQARLATLWGYEKPQPQVEQPVAVVTGFYGGFPTIRPLEPATVLPAGMALYSHPQPPRQPRTEQEIVDQTEKLAELFMKLFQQRVKEDPSTTMRGSSDVRAQFCWNVACRVQAMLTDTDPENAAAELENGIGDES